MDRFNKRSFRHTMALALCASAFLGVSQPAPAQGRGRQSQSAGQQDQADLQTAIDLTRAGKFQQAIPLLLNLQQQGLNQYVVGFNLALCYVGVAQYQAAIRQLTNLIASGRADEQIQNLLAQAYIGAGDQPHAQAAFNAAAALAPKDEKLYLFIADACLQSSMNDFGMNVVDAGLQHLPRSAPLHFDRAMLLIQLDRLDDARTELRGVTALAPGSDVAYIAATQEALFAANVPQALRVAHEGIRKGHRHFMLAALYGEAVLRAGLEPADPEFSEALATLERTASQYPDLPTVQLTLGKLYLAGQRYADAINRLDLAREMDPRNPAVYASLAIAYRRTNQPEREQEALALLARLNKEQADRIASAPGETKMGYSARIAHPNQ